MWNWHTTLEDFPHTKHSTHLVKQTADGGGYRGTHRQGLAACDHINGPVLPIAFGIFGGADILWEIIQQVILVHDVSFPLNTFFHPLAVALYGPWWSPFFHSFLILGLVHIYRRAPLTPLTYRVFSLFFTCLMNLYILEGIGQLVHRWVLYFIGYISHITCFLPAAFFCHFLL